jgi:hypothetical protein
MTTRAEIKPLMQAYVLRSVLFRLQVVQREIAYEIANIDSLKEIYFELDEADKASIAESMFEVTEKVMELAGRIDLSLDQPAPSGKVVALKRRV